MTSSSVLVDYAPLIVHWRPPVDLTEEQFFEFCRINRDLRIERAADGEVVIMSPAGGRTGDRNSEINMQLRQWAKRDGRGVAFDSSTGFRLPNGAVRAPDAAWVLRPRLDALADEAKERFLPLCPDFVIELRSPSDELPKLQDKMEEFWANGAQLGWLIDPMDRRVHVYESNVMRRELVNARELSGEPVLPGLVLNLIPIWEPSL
ncbi:MAG TPA: Uma2 family endonuclease [Candidatus Acidoferrum sp.]|nr:Uma2 family endonuclease [Candidatus Acidoferrum sp.]